MNRRIREFFDSLIEFINTYDDVPIEMKRLVIFIVLGMVEKKADEVINNEYLNMTEEMKDEQSIFEDKLGKLPE